MKFTERLVRFDNSFFRVNEAAFEWSVTVSRLKDGKILWSLVFETEIARRVQIGGQFNVLLKMKTLLAA